MTVQQRSYERHLKEEDDNPSADGEKGDDESNAVGNNTVANVPLGRCIFAVP